MWAGDLAVTSHLQGWEKFASQHLACLRVERVFRVEPMPRSSTRESLMFARSKRCMFIVMVMEGTCTCRCICMCVEARGQLGFSSNCGHLLCDKAPSWPEAYQLWLDSICPVTNPATRAFIFYFVLFCVCWGGVCTMEVGGQL